MSLCVGMWYVGHVGHVGEGAGGGGGCGGVYVGVVCRRRCSKNWGEGGANDATSSGVHARTSLIAGCGTPHRGRKSMVHNFEGMPTHGGEHADGPYTAQRRLQNCHPKHDKSRGLQRNGLEESKRKLGNFSRPRNAWDVTRSPEEVLWCLNELRSMATKGKEHCKKDALEGVPGRLWAGPDLTSTPPAPVLTSCLGAEPAMGSL